jgi:Bacterial Ig-like domain (group 3)
LREDMDRVRAASDQHAKREKYERGRAESQKLAELGNLGEAIARIQSLLEEFPGDQALMADLETIRGAKRLREERIRMDSLIGELDALFRKGDAEAVKRGAKEILSQHKEPRASELLDWAERSIAQTREIRRKSRARNPLMLWGGIGGLVVIAGAAIVLGIIGKRWHPLEFDVEPADMVFSYLQGSQIPKSQVLHIKAENPAQTWRVAKADSWLLISKVAGAGTSDLDIRIDPSGLSPRDYTSVAKVSSDSLQKTVMFHLEVTEPAERKPIRTTTTLASSSNPSTYGQSVILKGTLSTPAAMGTVTFKDGPAILGVSTLTGGTAITTLATLSAGTHFLTASYGGDATYAGSKAALTQSVKALSTTTMLSSLPNPSTYGQSVAFSAVISPSTATGTVTFYDGVNANILGSETVKGGTATMASTTLSVGLHNLTAIYAGDGNFAGSKSVVSMHTVKPVAPVDCHADSFTGLAHGRLTWKGDLPAGGELTINGRMPMPNGVVANNPLPGCPVNVMSQTEGAFILDPPALMDGYRRIRLTNKSGQPINSITIQWDVK